MTELTREQWLEVLGHFYKDCFNFWLRQDVSIDVAKERARTDLSVVHFYPYVPQGPRIPQDIKDEFMKRL